MFRCNDCEKCPYYHSWIDYFGSEDGSLTEFCEAGLNPEDGCKHSHLVRWILFKIEQRRLKKEDKRLLEEFENEV